MSNGNNARRSNSTVRNKQRKYWKSRGLPCGICGQPIDYSLGYITDEITGKRRMHPMAFVIDEIIPVSRWREGGYKSAQECALDISNQRPCHYICNARRGDGTRGNGVIHVVCGAPCSGKSSFIANNKHDDDIVIDLDAIAQSIGYVHAHGANGSYLRTAQAMRRAAIDEVLHHHYSAWIIHTQPSCDDIIRYETCGAIVHTLDPGINVCLQRARDDQRPDGTAKAIIDWYDKAGNKLLDHVLTSKRECVNPAQPFNDW